MPKVIEFPKVEPVWLFDRDCVRFFAIADNNVLTCLVSGEVLLFHFGAVRTLNAEECLRAFDEHKTSIEGAARRKIQGGSFTRDDEVLLRATDFPRQLSSTTATTTTTTSSRRDTDRGVVTVRSASLDANPTLKIGVAAANQFIEENLIRPGKRATAEWDDVPETSPSRVPVIRLTFTDSDTGATAFDLFTSDDLGNRHTARLSLFRLWDNLLQEKVRRRLLAFQVAAVAGE